MRPWYQEVYMPIQDGKFKDQKLQMKKKIA